MQATHMLQHAVNISANRAATHYRDRSRTWRELGERVPRLAAVMQRLGVRPGDFVSVLALNSDRYVELFYAVPWAGAVLAPLNVRWSVAENAYAIGQSRSRLLFVDENFLAEARDLREAVPDGCQLIYMGEGEAPDGLLHYENLLAGQPDGIPDADRRDEDLYLVFYTGGTTGHPKAVSLSHRAIVHATMGYLAMLPTIEDLSFLHNGGFFHFSGASPMWYMTLSGGTNVIIPKFDPLWAMEAIQRHRVTNSVLIPTMVNMLLNHPRFSEFDLSSLHTCIYGGSPMAEALMSRIMKVLPGWRFYQIYGMTESGGYATMLRWSDHLHQDERSKRLRSVGRAAPGFEVRVIRPDGTPAPTGTVGEITLRSDILMSGYLDDTQATEQALRGGWMHTGDAGHVDEDGYLYLADRIKDMIKTGGENVFSVEVEQALYKHPAVKEAAVIGLPDERWGETVHAVVSLRPGMQATAQQLIDHCRTLIGGYKCPRSVEFCDEMPLTPVGKIRKNVLRERALGRLTSMA